MITSAHHEGWPEDVPIGDYRGAGLDAPILQLNLFTLDNG